MGGVGGCVSKLSEVWQTEQGEGVRNIRVYPSQTGLAGDREGVRERERERREGEILILSIFLNTVCFVSRS